MSALTFTIKSADPSELSSGSESESFSLNSILAISSTTEIDSSRRWTTTNRRYQKSSPNRECIGIPANRVGDLCSPFSLAYQHLLHQRVGLRDIETLTFGPPSLTLFLSKAFKYLIFLISFIFQNLFIFHWF